MIGPCPRRDIPNEGYPNSPSEVRALSLYIHSELYKLRALSQGVTEVIMNVMMVATRPQRSEGVVMGSTIPVTVTAIEKK